MGSDFAVDVQALKDFAAAIRGKIIGNGSNPVAGMILPDDDVQTYLAAVAPPSGKAAPAGGFGEKHPDFNQAKHFDDETYKPSYLGWRNNFQDLLNSLETLATVAETLAGNYQAASDYDQVSAQVVDDAYDQAKVTPVPLTAGTGPPTTPTTQPS